MTFIPAELIKKKKRGENHNHDELAFIVNEFTAGNLPDYQVSAWLMAVCFKGMSDKETAHFTALMRDSGQVLNFEALGKAVVDKHSTGGVGDKTSLVVGPLAAAAGVPVPMIAGRGLGHTGGTLDKLESIPGFSVDMSLSDFQNNIRTHGISIIGQTAEICPADKKLYALRDVTGTVESLPLICGSIMSKKLAEGLSGLVLDVKFGSGAFMKTLDDCRQLATSLKSIGELNGVRVAALLTNMNQPLGQYIGNSLEVFECLQILKGIRSPLFEDTWILCLELSAWMIFLGGQAPTLDLARKRAEEILESGKAYEVFAELCHRQGGKNLEILPVAKKSIELTAAQGGYIASYQTEYIGIASLLLGAGRFSSNDKIDPSAGIECLVKPGARVDQGTPLFKIYGNDSTKMAEAKNKISAAITYSETTPDSLPLIAEVLF